jgi:Tol biopolymer transport system component
MRKNTLARFGLIWGLISLVFVSGCSGPEKMGQKPETVPPGILIESIPENADLLFVSMRYVLQDLACLDQNYHVKENFLNDEDCIKKIYNVEANVLASPRQLYSLDIETGEVEQLTNLACDFSSLKAINDRQIMAAGMCSDTDGDGLISTNDKPEIYLVNLEGEQVSCLSCGLGIRAINNPDYSPANKLVLFSAQWEDNFHNFLFTLDLERNLDQLTSDEEYMDFDCSWSEDGTQIVYSRLPAPFFEAPSQIWLMGAGGTDPVKMTDGGSNPINESPHGPYPIGIDADPDLSPDNSQIVFSRLRTGLQNEPFGAYDLLVLDIATKDITILDSNFANMIPEWKEAGIVLIRQIGSTTSVLDRKQSIYIYQDGQFRNLEPEHDIFPIGSNGASWID